MSILNYFKKGGGVIVGKQSNSDNDVTLSSGSETVTSLKEPEVPTDVPPAKHQGRLNRGATASLNKSIGGSLPLQ